MDKKYERKLYQDNKLGYLLIMIHIILNVVYTIMTLNSIVIDANVGTFVIIAIAMLLLGFLIAVKVNIYSMGWSIFAVAMGVFQLTTLFFAPELNDLESVIIINIFLVTSGLFCIAGGLVSVREASIHKKLLEQNNQAQA